MNEFHDKDQQLWSMSSPQQVLEAIEKWRRLNLRRLTADDIIKEMTAMRDLIGEYVVQSRVTTSQELWRVRKQVAGEDYSLVTDLWEPPSKSSRLGRCNLEGQPVLYCSKNAATALDECTVAAGERALLVKYNAKDLRLALVVGDLEPKELGTKPILCNEGLLAHQILREFLRAEFTKPVGDGCEFLYNISAAICQIWRLSDPCDGWLYPSVYSPAAENVAVIPTSAKSKITVESALIVEVTDTSVTSIQRGLFKFVCDGIKARVISTGSIAGDTVSWLPELDGRGFIFNREALLSA